MWFGELMDLINTYQSLERFVKSEEYLPPKAYKDALKKIEKMREIELDGVLLDYLTYRACVNNKENS